MSPAKSQQKRPLQRGPGRPNRGIRTGYVRVEAYVEPALRDALDQIADHQTQRSGQAVTRMDIMREALNNLPIGESNRPASRRCVLMRFAKRSLTT